LTNAIKYSGESEPIIVGISLEERFARIWVEDKGSGLSQEAKLRIWDRFYQVPGVREHKGSEGVGLGLGLSITQALIQQHGGMVGVESELWKGSTFWFKLPLA
jgi:signal transduction histidine kinase